MTQMDAPKTPGLQTHAPDAQSPETRSPTRAFALLVCGLLVARLARADHAPNLEDAAFALGFAALGLLLSVRFLRSASAPSTSAPSGSAPSTSAPSTSAPGPGLAPFAISLVLVVTLALSAAFAWHPALSAWALPSALGPLAALLAVLLVGASGRALVLFAVAAAGAMSACVSAAQVFVLWPDALARAEELALSPQMIARLESGRPLGLSLSPDLAGALALGGLAASLALVTTSRGAGRLVFLGTGAVGLVGVTLSRSAGVALAAAAFVLVTLALRALASRKLSPRALVAGAALFVVVPALSLALFGRGLDALERSAGERLDNWRIGVSAFTSDPVLGAGIGRFAATYEAHRVPGSNVTRYAHSLPVHALAETGVVGVAAGALLLGLFLLVVARAVRRGDPPLGWSETLVVAGAAALLLRCAYDYDAQIAQTATALAALVGVAWSDALRALRTSSSGLSAPSPEARQRAEDLSAPSPEARQRVEDFSAPSPEARQRAEDFSAPSSKARQAPEDFSAPSPASRFVPALPFAAIGVASALVLPALAAREAALEPFSHGSVPRPPDVERLARYAAAQPGDDHAFVLDLRVKLAGLSSCTQGCDEARARLERAITSRLDAPYPPADVAFLAAQLALARGDRAAALARAERGLVFNVAHRELHAIQVALSSHETREAARAEALRWMRAEELDARVSRLLDSFSLAPDEGGKKR